MLDATNFFCVDSFSGEFINGDASEALVFYYDSTETFGTDANNDGQLDFATRPLYRGVVSANTSLLIIVVAFKGLLVIFWKKKKLTLFFVFILMKVTIILHAYVQRTHFMTNEETIVFESHQSVVC